MRARGRGGGSSTRAAPAAARRALASLFDAALAALAPATLVRRALTAETRPGGRGPVLCLARRGAPPVRVSLAQGILVVGAGKAAAALAAAVEPRLGAHLRGGFVIVPPGYERRLRRIACVSAAHPVPDRRSVAATRRLLALLARHPAAAVLVLITGGASSLLVAPAPGVTLADKQRTTRLLLASGAPIGDVNRVRARLSQVKGGGLAAWLAGRPAAALVVSDVPGDALATIGSGPTVPGRATDATALAILGRHGLLARVPVAVRRRLGRGAAARRVARRGRALPTLLLARNATAQAGAARAARAAGLAVTRLRAPLVGTPAVAAARIAAAIARLGARAGAGPTLLVGGGETTVRLEGAGGRGGRNQELALEVARRLAGRPGWALLAAGTDGIDGPTDAAGAFVDGATVARAQRRGRDVAAALARHDVHPLLAAIGALFRPGPTGHNVADLVLALVWAAPSGGSRPL